MAGQSPNSQNPDHHPKSQTMASFRSALLLLFISVLVSFDDLILVPSCKISRTKRGDETKRNPGDLTVMMVADLLLKGSDAGVVDRYFRDFYGSKFLTKSLEKLQPDMLVVLGDISAKGSLSMASKWLTILQQFQGMLGPFAGTPLHIVLGDRDVGECSKLDGNFVSQRASNLPGLNAVGCGAFEISNTSFVSLNAIALACGNNDLRFGVEKVIESEHLDLQAQLQHAPEGSPGSNKINVDFTNFHWRQNDAASGSGPIVLLHLPLHQPTRSQYCGTNIIGDYPCEGTRTLVDSDIVDRAPYDLTETLPPNATEYIFHSLKPRMVFSAHTHHFCDYFHSDGTREVTVPAMTWAAKGEPGFVVATFRQNKAVTVSHCSLPKELHLIMAYLSMFVLLIATALVARWPYFLNLLWCGTRTISSLMYN